MVVALKVTGPTGWTGEATAGLICTTGYDDVAAGTGEGATPGAGVAVGKR